MKKNMGTIDRIVRAIIAIAVILLYVNGIIAGALGIFLIALAFVFLLTSMLSFCPLYLPFGLNTIRKKIHSKTN